MIPPFTLATLERRPFRSDRLAEGGAALLVFAEQDCPTTRATLSALSRSGARLVVVSEGSFERAADLANGAGLPPGNVLVERGPFPVSEAFGIGTVPTAVLVGTDGAERDRCEGWDREGLERLVAAAGGRLPDTELPAFKPGCASMNTMDPAMQATLEAETGAGADQIEELWRRGWHDGLPTVAPTPARVETMLGERDGQRVLGMVPPVDGVLTLERLAACAVLAGCAPQHFPIVIAAAEAILDPAFNAHGVQNTTHSASPVLIVNGPARARAEMHAGSNALGFGHRANATIGRAVRLMLALTGGGTPGGLDQSTMGGPHKFGLCFPEHEEASPWEPLHVDYGYDRDSSVVTALALTGPAGVSDHRSGRPEQLATTLTQAMEAAWAPSWYPLGTQTVLALCPEHALSFGEAGWSKRDLRTWIFEHAVRTVGSLRASGSGELSAIVKAASSDDEVVGKFADPDEIVIVVVGGLAGRWSAVMAPWTGFGKGSSLVQRMIDES